MLKSHHYTKLGYSTFFNSHTGAFARIEHKGFDEPVLAPFPELLDISITNWCDNACPFCYRQSSRSGHHMSLSDYVMLMDECSKHGVYQVALGGGNPNQHPDFVEILRQTKEEYDIVPSYTTSGRGLSTEILLASKKYCGAIAVSAYPPYSNLETILTTCFEIGLKTNIHFILSSESISTAIAWLKTPPSFLSKANALIFLNYKPVEQNSIHSSVKDPLVLQTFFQLTQKKLPVKIGFDSCSVSGLAHYPKGMENFIEGCDAGRFSMYVDEKLNAYPCSFGITKYQGASIKKYGSLLATWNESSLFQAHREHFLSSKCNGCDWKKVCGNGCYLFPEINLCSMKIEAG